MESFVVKKAAVLGAGVMGAQIAAHLANVGVQTILFDLAADQSNPNAIVLDSLKGLKKLKPSPLGDENILKVIQPANYDQHLQELSSCDFIVEAISERLDWKQNLFQKIMPYVNDNTILTSNTSGLSIEALKSVLSDDMQKRFCGVHFFNPPRYMKLVELIPHETTDSVILTQLETFLTTRMGKGVVFAKDTPNFVGNRIGVFSLLTTLYHAEELKISPEGVDALTGLLLGRPKSATYRTMDVVGLDTLQHVVNTMSTHLKTDPWFSLFKLPDWINGLVEKGALGQKTRVGIFKKEKDGIKVFDPNQNHYRPTHAEVSPEVKACFEEKDWSKRFAQMRSSDDKQMQFLWRIHRDLFHYCAFHLQDIAQTARDVDLALRWGYGWSKGPFEIWQEGNWHQIAQWIEEEVGDIDLPDWAKKATFKGPYDQGQSYQPAKDTYLNRSDNPVYKRQLYQDAVLSESFNQGDTLFENEGVRLWTLDNQIGIVSFKSKRNCIGDEVLKGIQESVSFAEKNLQGLVIWQNQGKDFSVGANLAQVTEAIKAERFDILEKAVSEFQKTALCLRYAKIPTVCALRGMVLGGGCELSMHASSRVAAFETYMGLVEIGVGLIPAGGGSKELAQKAANLAEYCRLDQPLMKFFEQIAYGKVSSSALEAKKFCYLKPEDIILANSDEILFGAIKQAQFLADMGYRPPISRKFKVLGKPGIANMQSILVNMREGQFITDYEYVIGQHIASVLCGGAVEANSEVDEGWVLRLEREAILDLLHQDQTRDRIVHMLKTGKPLRN